MATENHVCCNQNTSTATQNHVTSTISGILNKILYAERQVDWQLPSILQVS